MKQVREYVTLYLHLKYSKTNNDVVENKSKNSNDSVESKSESNNDAVESEVYNRLYKSKKDFLNHINQCSIDCNEKMTCRYHYWLWHFISTSLPE